MVALPGQLFYSTQIPACLWILARDKSANGHRDRRGEILFIDARKLGFMVDRVRREFTAEDIDKITGAYHRWRSKPETRARNGWADYADEPGFCRSASLEEVRSHGHVLTPGRYVGAADAEDDGVSFGEKFETLMATLEGQFAEAEELSALIRTKLNGVGDHGR